MCNITNFKNNEYSCEKLIIKRNYRKVKLLLSLIFSSRETDSVLLQYYNSCHNKIIRIARRLDRTWPIISFPYVAKKVKISEARGL